MIDLHNHILPGVDDGAKSVEEACEMARALLSQGVTAVCCTPHTTEWASAGDEPRIQQRVAELRVALASDGLGLELLAGAEAHITPSLAADVQRHEVPTLNGTPYLLLEFPYDSVPPFYERVVFELQVNGIRPVIAHPERIAPIADDPGILSGGFGPRLREVSELMLEHRLVHLIASDAHDAQPDGRLYALEGARSAATRLLGGQPAKALFEDTPARIVAGEPVAAPEPIMPKKRGFFSRAFR
jgi:protein-tyrosine phosphatase